MTDMLLFILGFALGSVFGFFLFHLLFSETTPIKDCNCGHSELHHNKTDGHCSECLCTMFEVKINER